MEDIKVYINYVAKCIEVIGVATIVVGALIALFQFGFSIQKVKPRSYKILRQELEKLFYWVWKY
jgi:hypothetical protein